ncbi:hypothetical protein [Streptomyces sp. NBC_01233]|uniref:hypothetical protein n=1 Tax=Streptomyces sp. NBC_01233 TaxID=2903787 RepID=UPI002E12EBBA|nr:hypothetical protein OG332_22620 [Streptomyces sp. NBC_01233]
MPSRTFWYADFAAASSLKESEFWIAGVLCELMKPCCRQLAAPGTDTHSLSWKSWVSGWVMAGASSFHFCWALSGSWAGSTRSASSASTTTPPPLAPPFEPLSALLGVLLSVLLVPPLPTAVEGLGAAPVGGCAEGVCPAGVFPAAPAAGAPSLLAALLAAGGIGASEASVCWASP